MTKADATTPVQTPPPQTAPAVRRSALPALGAAGLVLLALVGATLRVQTAAPQGAGPGTGGGAPGGGRGAAPPPAPQAGHGQGQLVIWGDTALFDGRNNPNNCILLSRFQRGMRMGFRMTAIDGNTGQVENTAVLTAHITYTSRTKGKVTVDVPLRWRGGAGPGSPVPAGYLRVPLELWTGWWLVPEDAETGMFSYTMTATDAFNRKASFTPFPDVGSQVYIVD